MLKSYAQNALAYTLKAALVVILFISGTNRSYGSHAAGADLTYRWLSGNTYEVTAAFYRDCGGIDEPNTVTLRYRSISCGINTTINLPKVNNGPVITYPCNSTQTTCNGGSTPGIQQWLYRGNITLPACNDWLLSYEVVARNCAITTIVQPSPCNSSTSYEPIYVEAFLNNLAAPGNSSPTFSNVPISFICLGQDFNYNHGVIDINADSLVYSLITPLTSTSTTVTYLAGYSATSPIQSSPAFSINPVSGDLFMHSTMLQVSVVAVKVQEYRNGILIGSVIRDMQIYSRNCSPNIVPAATGINSTNNFTAYVCPGTNLCFDINSSDANPGQVVNMTWNSGIPGATMNISGSPYPTGQFCWTPQPSDARDQPYTFTITVRDDACPLNGLQTYSYQVFVPKVDADVVSSDFSGFGVSCKNDANGSLTAVPTGGILPFTYLWNTSSVSETITNLSAGTYTVTVTDSKGCSNTFSGQVTEPGLLESSITGSENPSCDEANGSATVTGTGGAGGNEYLWSDLQTAQTATVLSPGTFTVTVTDDNGCTAQSQVTLQNIGNVYNIPVSASICQGSSYILPDGSTANSNGVYPVTLSGIHGCDSVIVTTLAVNPVINIQVTASICQGESYTLPDNSVVTAPGVYNTLLVSSGQCDSLIVTTLGINEIYSSDTYPQICEGDEYELPDGSTVTTAGNYTTTLQSLAGCDSVIITHLTYIQVSAPQVSASGSLAFCAGGSVTLTSTSAASYQWLRNGAIINGATSQSYTATLTGSYRVRITTACGDRLSSPVPVVKNAKPVVTISPSGASSFCGGDSLLLTASVAGNPAVNYQWYRNNVLIPGATSSTYYVTANGNYKVIATNSVTGCSGVSNKVQATKLQFNASISHDIPLTTCYDDITFTLSTNAGPGATYQWKRNNVDLQNVTGLTYTTKTAGNYKVLVTAANGCTRYTNSLKVIVDCEDNVRIASGYKVYPNPARGIITVEKEKGEFENGEAELLDVMGRKILEFKNLNSAEGKIIQFDSGNLPRGIYYLRIVENYKISSVKVVLE